MTTPRHQRRRQDRRRDKSGTGGFFSLRRGVGFGAVAVAVLIVVAYLLWPSKAPALAFDKEHVELGGVARDLESIQTFLVMNEGGKPLEVGPVNIRVELGCDTAETVKTHATMEPGEMVLLPIKLGPHRQLGPHRLLVEVPSNDPVMPLAALSVSFDVQEEPRASGVGPRLRFDRETIDIGTVPYDRPMYERFTLRNDGDTPLVLEGTPVVRVEEGC